ncbi:hypothetical protein QFZ55_000053 [Streptomyces luteogriseus]|uniref:hypothetical protein n=1 Tax=Streptomyces luteogriseus TaxID=68233 RepID=UPI002787E0B5|nr:hypothetical protein [Streptomyces luteogriseus]MDQ0710601.1 hypothetical protein [Streptomyces luteogriseus]
MQTASKAEARRWKATPNAIYRPWSLRWCPPYEEHEERERAVAEQRERERTAAAREARCRRVLELQEWAAAVLADEALVVLDTETTWLDREPCVVKLAVISDSGDVWRTPW